MEGVRAADASGVPVPRELRRRAVVSPSAPTEDLVSGFLLPSEGGRARGDQSATMIGGSSNSSSSQGAIDSVEAVEAETAGKKRPMLARDLITKSWLVETAGSKWEEDPNLDLDEVRPAGRCD